MQEDSANMLSVADAETGEQNVAEGGGTQPAGVRTSHTERHGRTASASEAPAIDGLQAAAGAFNAAFAAALSELESARAGIEGRSARIGELDETVRELREAMDEEVGRGRKREEEYTREREQLEQRIHAAESERDLIQEKVRKQERTLEERSVEISELFTRIEEFKTALQERTAAEQNVRKELANEKNALTGKLAELQGLYDAAERQLQARQHELEECNRELGTLREQLENLHSEVESRDAEAAHLNRQVKELQGKIDTQAESLRVQSESHAAACEELNTRISGVNGELEVLRAAHDDLKMHAENLERLNRTLHESFITEQKVHSQQLDEKTLEIELLHSRLECTESPSQQRTDEVAQTVELRRSLYELEARLEELGDQNKELASKADEADRLRKLNSRLRAALQELHKRVGGSAGGLQEQQTQVAGLQAALEAAKLREQELAGKLQGHERLEQEVIGLRKAESKMESGAAALEREVENLSAALSASEERCRQLQQAFASKTDEKDPGVVLQVVPDKLRDTAAPGRARFVEQLDELLAARSGSGQHHSLMYILVDNFNSIRDEIGVMESESVVTDVARIIEASCSTTDSMTRFGDCTFAVLCRNTTVEQAGERAEGIRSEVEARIFEQAGKSLVATTSTGICSIRNNDTAAKDIIARADLACEAARLSGGNKVIASSTIADEMTIRCNEDEHREMVRRTIEANRIRIHYQPILSLREKTASHFEVLIRLVDESGDMILPGEFFAMAEGAGYAGAVDRYVIDRTIQVISENGDQQVRYFIKLTRQSVLDTDLAAWIVQRVSEHGIRPDQLVFEIAEHIMQSDLRNVASLTEALNKAGCLTAIEHYRMSTSLQHLKHVYANYLKIDRGLVGAVEEKGEPLARITEIMDLAKNINCITIAEGVETSGSLAMLWQLGVNMAQGYFIQAPAAAPDNVDHAINNDCSEAAGSKANLEVS